MDEEYEITEDLEFKIFIDEKISGTTITADYEKWFSYKSYTNTSVITLDRAAYDSSVELCMILLKRVKASYDKLNEVEKFIIKSLEFNRPPETDEELINRLKTYKNGYYLAKKSAYLKMAMQLDIKNVKKSEDIDSVLKNALADVCIKVIGNSEN